MIRCYVSHHSHLTKLEHFTNKQLWEFTQLSYHRGRVRNLGRMLLSKWWNRLSMRIFSMFLRRISVFLSIFSFVYVVFEPRWKFKICRKYFTKKFIHKMVADYLIPWNTEFFTNSYAIWQMCFISRKIIYLHILRLLFC